MPTTVLSVERKFAMLKVKIADNQHQSLKIEKNI